MDDKNMEDIVSTINDLGYSVNSITKNCNDGQDAAYICIYKMRHPMEIFGMKMIRKPSFVGYLKLNGNDSYWDLDNYMDQDKILDLIEGLQDKYSVTVHPNNDAMVVGFLNQGAP